MQHQACIIQLVPQMFWVWELQALRVMTPMVKSHKWTRARAEDNQVTISDVSVKVNGRIEQNDPFLVLFLPWSPTLDLYPWSLYHHRTYRYPSPKPTTVGLEGLCYPASAYSGRIINDQHPRLVSLRTSWHACFRRCRAYQHFSMA